jgi:hypothetical protein
MEFILKEGTTKQQIIDALRERHPELTLDAGHVVEDVISYDDRKIEITMPMYLPGIEEIKGTKCRCNARHIAESLCKHFGGFINEHNGEQDVYVPIELDKFMLNVKDRSEYLKLKIIYEVGYINYKKVFNIVNLMP